MISVVMDLNERNLKAEVGLTLVHEFMHHLYSHCGAESSERNHHRLMYRNQKMWKVMEEIASKCTDDSIAKIWILYMEAASCSPSFLKKLKHLISQRISQRTHSSP